MAFTELFRDISGLLSGAELVDAVKRTASVVNTNDGVDITLEKDGNLVTHHIEASDEERFSLLKKAMVFVSDFNNASNNSVLKFPFPKSKKELLSYVENRDMFLSFIYRKDKEQLKTHDNVQIPNVSLDELIEEAVEEPKKKKSNNSGGNARTDNAMTFDDIVNSVEKSEKSHSDKVKTTSIER